MVCTSSGQDGRDNRCKCKNVDSWRETESENRDQNLRVFIFSTQLESFMSLRFSSFFSECQSGRSLFVLAVMKVVSLLCFVVKFLVRSF